MKLTQKQEGFVLSILEGKSQADAYRNNYNCANMKNDTIYVKANELMNNDKIKVRMETLRNEIAKASKWTVERMIKEFENVKEKCMQEVEVLDKFGNGTGEYIFKENGVVKSLENIGKLCGFYVEKVESKNVNLNKDIDGLTVDEIDKEIELLNKKLGE